MFIIIMVSICKHTRSMSTRKESLNNLKPVKQNLTIAVTLAVMFGLGWILGLVATSLPVKEVTLVFQILFSIFVGAQGALIFILHGVRNEEARKLWIRCLKFIGHKSRISYLTLLTKSTSTTGTSESVHGVESYSLGALPPNKNLSENVIASTTNCSETDTILRMLKSTS